jgi:hypothetical protein
VSGAAYTGYLPLGDNFAWLGTAPSLVMLTVAAIVEILAYYIPGLDNLLDALATPAAFVAGTVLSAAVMTDIPPMVKWTAAVIAGGGIAGVTQGVTATLRANSTVWTGGLGNFIIATAELGGALLVAFLALAAPVAAIALVVLFYGSQYVCSVGCCEECVHRPERKRRFKPPNAIRRIGLVPLQLH